jgi:hypothetical protein
VTDEVHTRCLNARRLAGPDSALLHCLHPSLSPIARTCITFITCVTSRVMWVQKVRQVTEVTQLSGHVLPPLLFLDAAPSDAQAGIRHPATQCQMISSCKFRDRFNIAFFATKCQDRNTAAECSDTNFSCALARDVRWSNGFGYRALFSGRLPSSVGSADTPSAARPAAKRTSQIRCNKAAVIRKLSPYFTRGAQARACERAEADAFGNATGLEPMVQNYDSTMVIGGPISSASATLTIGSRQSALWTILKS